jgi:hypothetical protein
VNWTGFKKDQNKSADFCDQDLPGNKTSIKDIKTWLHLRFIIFRQLRVAVKDLDDKGDPPGETPRPSQEFQIPELSTAHISRCYLVCGSIIICIHMNAFQGQGVRL